MWHSPEKSKQKASQKKKSNRNKTTIRQNTSNYSEACESLLSIIFDKNRNSSKAAIAIPALKKSGPDLPNLLTQFSASIAGTGIAVLFSVICKVASGRVPFCSSKLLNTGLGLGLVWLSWAVNRLRDTIVMINKNSNKKKGLKDEEMMKQLDTSVKEIYFRAGALMMVMVLRLAWIGGMENRQLMWKCVYYGVNDVCEIGKSIWFVIWYDMESISSFAWNNYS